MSPSSKPDRNVDSYGLAVYLATMSASMAKIAHQNGFDALAYLFELAHLEAETIRLQVSPSRSTGTDD